MGERVRRDAWGKARSQASDWRPARRWLSGEPNGTENVSTASGRDAKTGTGRGNRWSARERSPPPQTRVASASLRPRRRPGLGRCVPRARQTYAVAGCHDRGLSHLPRGLRPCAPPMEPTTLRQEHQGPVRRVDVGAAERNFYRRLGALNAGKSAAGLDAPASASHAGFLTPATTVQRRAPPAQLPRPTAPSAPEVGPRPAQAWRRRWPRRRMPAAIAAWRR